MAEKLSAIDQAKRAPLTENIVASAKEISKTVYFSMKRHSTKHHSNPGEDDLSRGGRSVWGGEAWWIRG